MHLTYHVIFLINLILIDYLEYKNQKLKLNFEYSNYEIYSNINMIN